MTRDVRTTDITAQTRPEAPDRESDVAALEESVGQGRGGYGGGRRRSAYATRDLTRGSIPRNLIFLAWPQMVSGSLQTLDVLADLVWAGFIGSRAIASIGLAQAWTQLVMTARMGLDTSTRAMVSRAVGAGNIPLANHVAMQSFFFSGAISLTLAVLGVLFTEMLLRLLGASDGIIAQGALYMRYQFVASFTMSMLWMGSSVLQASGDTITSMKAQFISRILHIILSPLLMFGWLGFPEFGLAGAALANALAQVAGAGMNFYVLFNGSSRLQLSFKGFRLDFPVLKRMVQIGIPASITGMERAMAHVIVVGLVVPFGDFSLAAFSITERVQMFVNLGSMGLGNSAGILVGQNLGAQRPERASATVWWALGFVLLANFLVGGLILLFPTAFLSVFTRETALLEAGVPWLQIRVIGFMVMGAGMVFMNSFNTAGDTGIPMWVTLFTMWGIEVPVAIMLSGSGQDWAILGLHLPVPAIGSLGEFGIAWAGVIALAARLLIYFPYFLWGPWMKKQVL